MSSKIRLIKVPAFTMVQKEVGFSFSNYCDGIEVAELVAKGAEIIEIPNVDHGDKVVVLRPLGETNTSRTEATFIARSSDSLRGIVEYSNGSIEAVDWENLKKVQRSVEDVEA